MTDFLDKYLKYKNKYLKHKNKYLNIIGGTVPAKSTGTTEKYNIEIYNIALPTKTEKDNIIEGTKLDELGRPMIDVLGGTIVDVSGGTIDDVLGKKIVGQTSNKSIKPPIEKYDVKIINHFKLDNKKEVEEVEKKSTIDEQKIETDDYFYRSIIENQLGKFNENFHEKFKDFSLYKIKMKKYYGPYEYIAMKNNESIMILIIKQYRYVKSNKCYASLSDETKEKIARNFPKLDPSERRFGLELYYDFKDNRYTIFSDEDFYKSDKIKEIIFKSQETDDNNKTNL
jgi:hypothetical protein